MTTTPPPPPTKINDACNNKLILYFMGMLTVMFLLIGTFYLIQILKIQTNQAVLLDKINQGIDVRHQEHLHLQQLSEQILNYTSHLQKSETYKN